MLLNLAKIAACSAESRLRLIDQHREDCEFPRHILAARPLVLAGVGRKIQVTVKFRGKESYVGTPYGTNTTQKGFAHCYCCGQIINPRDFEQRYHAFIISYEFVQVIGNNDVRLQGVPLRVPRVAKASTRVHYSVAVPPKLSAHHCF
jgi:hypothetical protein